MSISRKGAAKGKMLPIQGHFVKVLKRKRKIQSAAYPNISFDFQVDLVQLGQS